LRPADLPLRLKRWRFGWIDACHHLFSNRWINGTKHSGKFSSLCRLILSQVNSSAPRSEWRLMLLLLQVENKDCLNSGKTGCFLYLFWFIVCLKRLFELCENNLSLNFCNVCNVSKAVAKGISTNQQHYQDLGSARYSVCNFCARYSDVVLLKWRPHKTSAVFMVVTWWLVTLFSYHWTVFLLAQDFF